MRLREIWEMLNYGFASIGIDEPRPRRRYELPTYEIPKRELFAREIQWQVRREPRHFLTAGERWYALGERLRKAADKVTGGDRHGEGRTHERRGDNG